MTLFTKLALTAASIAGVLAMPYEPSAKHATHRRRMVSRGLGVEIYHPENTFQTFDAGVETPLKKRGEVISIEESAASFIEEQLNISQGDFKIRSSSSTDTGGHVWVQQVVVRTEATLIIAFLLKLYRTAFLSLMQ